jgi:hypothetical protein
MTLKELSELINSIENSELSEEIQISLLAELTLITINEVSYEL